MPQAQRAAAQRAVRSSGKQTRLALLRAADEVFREHGERASVARSASAPRPSPTRSPTTSAPRSNCSSRSPARPCCAPGGIPRKPQPTPLLWANTPAHWCAPCSAPNATACSCSPPRWCWCPGGRDLRSFTGDTLRLLHERGEAALHRTLTRTGWQLRTSIEVEAKAFWSAIFGVAVQMSAIAPRTSAIHSPTRLQWCSPTSASPTPCSTCRSARDPAPVITDPQGGPTMDMLSAFDSAATKFPAKPALISWAPAPTTRRSVTPSSPSPAAARPPCSPAVVSDRVIG